MPVGRSGMGVAVTMEPCPGSLPEQEEDEDEICSSLKCWMRLQVVLFFKKG